MSRVEEREVARLLAGELERPGSGGEEAAELAGVLRRAASGARFEPTPAELAHGLERARAGRRAHPRRRRRTVVAVSLAAAAVAALLLLPDRGGPLHGVERARAALGGRTTVVSVALGISPAVPGAFPASERVTLLDPAHHRRLSEQTVDGETVERTLSEPGRFVRYQPLLGRAIVAPGCGALASGCAEARDPLEIYRRALADAPADAPLAHVRAGLRLVLPVQRLPGAVEVQQVATLDPSTYLPRRIVWRERRAGGAFRAVTLIRVLWLRRVGPSTLAPDAFRIDVRPGTRVRQLRADGRAVRILGRHALSPPQARRLRRPVQWLGEAYAGRPVRVEAVRLTGGLAMRVAYGPLVVWTYQGAVPPPLAAGRFVPFKAVPFGQGVVRFYTTPSGALAAERDTPRATVAVVAPQARKLDLIDLLRRLRPLR